MLPQLRRLEAQFEHELVVIGVHAGKYPNERRTPHLADAVQRLGIVHPILNDRKYRTWRAYGISAWPTLALIDPRGRLLGVQPGETSADRWATLLQRLIAEEDAQGTLDRGALPFAVGTTPEPPRALRYPEKLLADGAGRLFIADTGHQRIVVAERRADRWVLAKIIGSGERGRSDGSIVTASFDGPRGLALLGETLYVADTGNHLLRAVDLASGTVRTVAGTGERGRQPFARGRGAEVALASPWDLVTHAGRIIIAMAGLHQLWSFDPASAEIGPLAGDAHEALADGPLLAAVLAQPSGITGDGQRLFFADSESQAIRAATLGPDGAITTIVGTGLFDFGDKDGSGDDALLQHPQAVAAHAGRLYVADSYNHKLKLVDPATRECRTFAGARRIPGLIDGRGDEAAFSEPGGLAIADDTLYVADTNNHALRAVDLATGAVRTLDIDGLAPI